MRRTGKASALIFALALPAQAETVIAALGDSLTQGYGLPAAQGFVPQLQGWLSERGLEVRVINAGVSGDTTAGGLSRIAWTLTPEVDGVIIALGGNDVLRALPPEMSRGNIDAMLTIARDAQVPALLIGMQAPGNYGPAYKQAFDALYPDLAAQYDVPLIPSFLAPIAVSEASTLMQPDGIHPNADGVARIVDQIGPEIARWISQDLSATP